MHIGPRARRALWLGLGFGLGLGAAGGAVLLAWGWPALLGPSTAIDPEQVARLEALGRRALASEDIPVAALLLYRGEVVGEGHNTVRAHHDAGGHAEIQALSAALRRFGVQAFFELDRQELELVSTFEPCPMCQGALTMYGIRKVTFLGAKPLGQHLELEEARLRYLWSRRWAEPADLQERLFELHPSRVRAREAKEVAP